jgi:predicted Zn finger-like uncharacterized protein
LDFSCDKCSRRYTLPDEKVLGKVVKVRCKHCANIIQVGPLETKGNGNGKPVQAPPLTSIPVPTPSPKQKPPQLPWEKSSTQALPTLDPSTQWFAMIEGKQTGPLSTNELTARVKSGKLTLRTYVWRDGMGDWKRTADVPELAILLTRVSEPEGPVAPPLPSLAATHPAVKSPAPRGVGQPFGKGLDLRIGGKEASEERTTLMSEYELQHSPALMHGAGGRANVAVAPAAKKATRPVGAPKSLSALELGALFPEIGEALPKPTLEPSVPPAEERVETSDPFRSLGDFNPEDLPPPGEATSFFIAQAGVNNRNPWWKIVGALAATAMVLFLVFYLATKVALSRQAVFTQDEAGHAAPPPGVFSREGVSALSDLLLGRQRPKPAPTRPAARPKPPPPAPGAGAHGEDKTGTALLDTDTSSLLKGTAAENRQIKDALGKDKKDVRPTLAQVVRESKDDPNPGGPPEEDVAKTVGKYQPAFQSCIETQLKREPNFRGGKIKITVNVAPSGVVRAAAIDKSDIDRSALGDCLKLRARKMLFPAFAGADVDIEIPLVLGASM